MSCGEIKVKITPPTMGARKPSQGQLDSQVSELDALLRGRALSSNMDEETRSYLQSLADVQIRRYGWLDGGVAVEFCAEESIPVSMPIKLQVQQRKMIDGEWSGWHGLNLNNPIEGLSVGHVFQRRISSRGDSWKEEPVMVLDVDEAGNPIVRNLNDGE